MKCKIITVSECSAMKAYMGHGGKALRIFNLCDKQIPMYDRAIDMPINIVWRFL
jgi:hypothetical protein